MKWQRNNISFDEEINWDCINRGRDIKVGIYDDIVNIVSPGGLPNNLIQEELYEGRSEIRNKVIARVFKEINYVEQWGTGIARMKKLREDYGLNAPSIRESGDFIDVEFFRADNQ